MQSREIEIINKLGMHARAAAKFVAEASRFESVVEIEKTGRRVNGKSMMGVLMLAAARGATITIRADGPDECAALETLESLVRNRFGENE